MRIADKFSLLISPRYADGAQLATIVRLAAMGRASKAVEAVGVGVGVEGQRFDLADTGCDQAVHDIGFKVEMRLARRAVDKEALVVRVSVDETRAKFLVHFVARLRNARPDRSVDTLPARPKLLHGLDGCIRDSSQRTAP